MWEQKTLFSSSLYDLPTVCLEWGYFSVICTVRTLDELEEFCSIVVSALPLDWCWTLFKEISEILPCVWMSWLNHWINHWINHWTSFPLGFIHQRSIGGKPSFFIAWNSPIQWQPEVVLTSLGSQRQSDEKPLALARHLTGALWVVFSSESMPGWILHIFGERDLNTGMDLLMVAEGYQYIMTGEQESERHVL